MVKHQKWMGEKWRGCQDLVGGRFRLQVYSMGHAILQAPPWAPRKARLCWSTPISASTWEMITLLPRMLQLLMHIRPTFAMFLWIQRSSDVRKLVQVKFWAWFLGYSFGRQSCRNHSEFKYVWQARRLLASLFLMKEGETGGHFPYQKFCHPWIKSDHLPWQACENRT